MSHDHDSRHRQYICAHCGATTITLHHAREADELWCTTCMEAPVELPPIVPPVRLEAWIRENFAGHGRALRRETDAPLEGEPWMSMDDAKELVRQAVALFGRTQ
jgi:hypothetical protein